MCTNSLTALWLQSSKTLKHMNSPNNKGLKAWPYIKVKCNVGTSFSLAFRETYKTQRTKSVLPPLGTAGKEWGHSSPIQGQLRKMYLQNAYVFVYTTVKYTYIGGITYCFLSIVRVQHTCNTKGPFSHEKTSKVFTGFAFTGRHIAILWKRNMLLCFPWVFLREGIRIKHQPKTCSNPSSHKSNVSVQVSAMITFGGGMRETDEWFTVWKVALQGLGQGKSERCWGKMGVEWRWWMYCHLIKVTCYQDLLRRCHWGIQKTFFSNLRQESNLLSEQEYYQEDTFKAQF